MSLLQLVLALAGGHQRGDGGRLRVRQARRRRAAGRRIRERTLWILCLAGGVGGAWLVFFGMRHKTRHRSFWVVQSVATVLWVVILARLVLG